MIAPQGTLIQFSCAANQASNDDCFAKHFLENITQEYVEINIILQDISNTVYHNNNNQRRPWSMNNLQSDRHVYFNGKYLLRTISVDGMINHDKRPTDFRREKIEKK